MVPWSALKIYGLQSNECMKNLLVNSLLSIKHLSDCDNSHLVFA